MPGRRHLPGEAVDHPFASGRPQAGPQRRIVEQAGDGAGQCARVVGGDQQAGLPVGAHDFGQRAPGGGDHGHAARHGLDGRQGESLVQRGHHGDLGLAVQAGQLVVADPADAVARCRTGPSRVMALSTRPPFVRPADDRQLHVTLGAQLGHRFEEGHQPLHGDVARRRHHDPARFGRDVVAWGGTRCGPRRPGTTVMRSGRTCICAAMSLREDCETVTTAGRARATRTCMPKKPNQRRGGEALPRVRGVRERQLAVHGDRMVQGRQQRPAVVRPCRASRCRGTGCRGPRRSRPGAPPAAGAPDGRRPGAPRTRRCT